ncbi:MAG: maleylpyruvate isomerase N-terminal domain-containing protein [Anaerolineales bacterium]|nr:maleylpyruvate isomerase N-terminal domain-containing protein [Anaerolineales bacterium]
MQKRQELITRLERSHAIMLAHLDKVDKNRKIYPLWTIREILAHLSGWDDAVISFVRTILEGGQPGLTVAAEGVDVYNAATVSTREGLSYDQVYREYVQTRRILLDLLLQVPEEEITRAYVLPWGGYGTLEDLVRIFAPHEEEHAADIRNIVDAAEKKA